MHPRAEADKVFVKAAACTKAEADKAARARVDEATARKPKTKLGAFAAQHKISEHGLECAIVTILVLAVKLGSIRTVVRYICQPVTAPVSPTRTLPTVHVSPYTTICSGGDDDVHFFDVETLHSLACRGMWRIKMP